MLISQDPVGGLVAARASFGRAAGFVITLASLVTLATVTLLSGLSVPVWFDLLAVGSATYVVSCFGRRDTTSRPGPGRAPSRSGLTPGLSP